MKSKTNENIGIIGTGSEWSGLPVVRSVGDNVHLLSQNINTTTSHSKYIKVKHQLFQKLDNDLISQIISICVSNNIKNVICLDEEIKYLLVKKNIKDKIIFASPSLRNYAISFKKNKSSAFVASLGVPVPKIIKIENESEIDNQFNNNKRIVIRGIRGVSSLCVRYANNKNELTKYYKELIEMDTNNQFVDSKPFLQEYVGGPTYLTQALAQNGKVKIVIPHFKFREWPLSGGVTSRAVTIYEPRLIKYTKLILNALNWHGEAGIEWKYDENKNDFTFIEINPRFEGSVDLAIKAGVNLPLLLLNILKNKRIPNNLKYKIGIHYRWFFRNDYKNFLWNDYGLTTLIKEAFDPKIHQEIVFKDINVIKSLWKAPLSGLVQRLKE